MPPTVPNVNHINPLHTLKVRTNNTRKNLPKSILKTKSKYPTNRKNTKLKRNKGARNLLSLKNLFIIYIHY